MANETDKDKRARVTISISEDLLEKIDQLASENYTTRSQWIVNIIVEKLKKDK